MKYIFQFARLAAFCLAGELLHALLVALATGLVKLHQVREAALFLTGIFPLLFVPAAADAANRSRGRALIFARPLQG